MGVVGHSLMKDLDAGISLSVLFTFLAFYILIRLTRKFANKSSLRYPGEWRMLADKQMTNSTAPDIFTLSLPTRPRRETKIKMILNTERGTFRFDITPQSSYQINLHTAFWIPGKVCRINKRRDCEKFVPSALRTILIMVIELTWSIQWLLAETVKYLV